MYQRQELIEHIHRVAPGVPVILDAKRGDIGSTAEQYAREAFERYQADAVTLSPLMGFDSIEPYLQYPDKGLILLCRTSNAGGADLQAQTLVSGERVYEHIARLAQGPWNRSGQLGLVVEPFQKLALLGLCQEEAEILVTVAVDGHADAMQKRAEGDHDLGVLPLEAEIVHERRLDAVLRQLTQELQRDVGDDLDVHP